jgi:hypothetical protein
MSMPDAVRRYTVDEVLVLKHAGPRIRVKPKDLEAAGVRRVPRVAGGRDGLRLQDTDTYVEPAGGWTVYDPEGRAIARIHLPENITVYDIGPDYVLGLEKDDLDVDHVRMYRVRRTGG